MTIKNLDKISNDLYNTIKEINIIRIQLVRYHKHPEKIRQLAKQLEKLL